MREPLYREVAHMVVDTDHRSVGSVVRELVKRLGSGEGLPEERSATLQSEQAPNDY
jgi:hypothetical protein